uniref:PttA' n=1 Tax=Petunia hybrida TaxID=4102 RepID=O22369_PETHY|nr:PttA' [Petunia x hybrida]
MTRGRGRGRGKIGRGGRSIVRGNVTARLNMPTVPTPEIVPEQGGTNCSGGPTDTPPVRTSVGSGSPNIHFEASPAAPNQSATIGEGVSVHNNTAGEVESSSSHGRRTLLTLSPTTGLEPSRLCSESISAAFRHELDPNGINWKNVSQELKDFYYGEFKAFYWDSSIENAVKIAWKRKAARRYSDFISKIKADGIQLNCIHDNVWASWLRLWEDPKCREKSETAQRNRCGGNEVALGTHTGGSITIGEHRKRLVIDKGRDVTPAEIHLHVHTHGHDGKSFVGERSRIVHERYEEILQQTQTQSDIDKCQAYYQAAGGEKKRRVYGLGCEAQNYYGQHLRPAFGSDATSSVPPSSAQQPPIGNMDEFMTRLIPALTDHMLPLFIERVRAMIPSSSNQSNTVADSPSSVAPMVNAPTDGNIDGVHSSGSDDQS